MKKEARWFTLENLNWEKYRLYFYYSLRSCGKTTGCLRYILENKIKTVWIRRTSEEMRKFLQRLLNYQIIIDWIEKGHKITLKDNHLWLNSEKLIYFVPFSTSYNNASGGFDDIELIIWDEYISRTQIRNTYYLNNNEYDALVDLLSTFERSKIKKVLFIANTITKNNPLFNELELSKKTIESGDFEIPEIKAKFIKWDYPVPNQSKENVSYLLAKRKKSIYDYIFKGEFSLDEWEDLVIDSEIVKRQNVKDLYTVLIDNVFINVKKDLTTNELLFMQTKPQVNFLGASRLDTLSKITNMQVPKNFWTFAYKFIVNNKARFNNYIVKDIIINTIIILLGRRFN